jgi:hypothetical protein
MRLPVPAGGKAPGRFALVVLLRSVPGACLGEGQADRRCRGTPGLRSFWARVWWATLWRLGLAVLPECVGFWGGERGGFPAGVWGTFGEGTIG